jgi:hypothetical protein
VARLQASDAEIVQQFVLSPADERLPFRLE